MDHGDQPDTKRPRMVHNSTEDTFIATKQSRQQPRSACVLPASRSTTPNLLGSDAILYGSGMGHLSFDQRALLNMSPFGDSRKGHASRASKRGEPLFSGSNDLAAPCELTSSLPGCVSMPMPYSSSSDHSFTFSHDLHTQSNSRNGKRTSSDSSSEETDDSHSNSAAHHQEGAHDGGQSERRKATPPQFTAEIHAPSSTLAFQQLHQSPFRHHQPQQHHQLSAFPFGFMGSDLLPPAPQSNASQQDLLASAMALLPQSQAALLMMNHQQQQQRQQQPLEGLKNLQGGMPDLAERLARSSASYETLAGRKKAPLLPMSLDSASSTSVSSSAQRTKKGASPTASRTPHAPRSDLFIPTGTRSTTGGSDNMSVGPSSAMSTLSNHSSSRGSQQVSPSRARELHNFLSSHQQAPASATGNRVIDEILRRGNASARSKEGHTDFGGLLPSQPASFASDSSYLAEDHGTSDDRSSVVTEDSSRASKRRHRTFKVDKDTVLWLKSNFEVKKGRTVERKLVYKAYVAHMESLLQAPSNSAAFGKTMKTVFPTVSSRRLGSRGKSMYHYDGLRIKPSSTVAMLKLAKESEGTPSVDGSEIHATLKSNDPTMTTATLMMVSQIMDKSLELTDMVPLTREAIAAELDAENGPALLDSIDDDALTQFSELYFQHCCEILDAVKGLRFAEAYSMIPSFWASLPDDCRPVIQCHTAAVFLEMWDTTLYDTILHVFIPQVLNPLCDNAQDCIRSFVADLRSSVRTLGAESSFPLPDAVLDAKNAAVQSCAQLLNRRLALNKVATTAAKFLGNKAQMELIAHDFERVDFEAIKDQSEWITNCNINFVEEVHRELLTFLSQPRSLGLLSEWLDGIVQRFFNDVAGVNLGKRLHTSRSSGSSSSSSSSMASSAAAISPRCLKAMAKGSQDRNPDHRTSGEKIDPSDDAEKMQHFGGKLVLAWNYFSSQVLRELTIHTVPTFGSCSVLAMLLDEYIYYLVHTRCSHPNKPIVHPSEDNAATDEGEDEQEAALPL